MASRGTLLPGLNVCATTNRKKIIGSQRIKASTVSVLALPAFRSEVALGFCNNWPKSDGPLLLLKAKIIAAKNNTEQNVKTRVNSSSENSQRALINRELSKMEAIAIASGKKSACQPQKSRAAPMSNGGVFILNNQECQRAIPVGAAHFHGPGPFSSWHKLHPQKPLFNLPGNQCVKMFRLIPHWAGVKWFLRLIGENDHDPQRNPQGLDFFHKAAARFIPGQQNTNTSADGAHMIEGERFERLKRFIHADIDGREDFEHLVHMGHPAADGKTIRLRADKKQIQQRFLGADPAGKRRSH